MHSVGVIAAAAGGGGISPVTVTVTVGTIAGGNRHGFADSSQSGGPYGSVSPAQVGGEDLAYLGDGQSAIPSVQEWFEVRIVGSHPQDFFDSIDVEDPDGGVRTFNTASADLFNEVGGDTRWQWDMADYVWDTEVGNDMTVDFS